MASADECEDFYEAVLKKNNIPFPEIKKNDLAIFFDYEWIKKNNKISIKRNKDDYPIVRVSLFEDKLLPGTIIKTIDGKDLSKTKDADIMNIIENSVSSEIEYFAEKEVKRLLNKYPNNIVYQNFLAIIYVNQKKFNEAKIILQKIIDNSPKFIDAHINLGNI